MRAGTALHSLQRTRAAGKPDFIAKLPAPFKVPAEGAVDYKNFYIKTSFPEDRWVTAVEIKPTQPTAVHHALAYLEEPGRTPLTKEELDRLKPGDPVRPLPSDGVRGFFAATVPGSMGIVFPPGTGKKLPKGAWLKVEMHYQPTGKVLMDRTEIGFRFAKTPVSEVTSLSAFNTELLIPPHAERVEVKAEYRFQQSGRLLSLFPHMHLRGSGFQYDVEYPNGVRKTLLVVPKFDFGWQSFYQLKDPLPVPRGARLLVTAWYDNSKKNPWNPDPSKTVRWGQQTTDEMMIGYFDFAADSS